MLMIKLESPGHGIFYVDPFFVIAVKNHRFEDEDHTRIYFQNSDVVFEVLGAVHEVMDELGLKHE